MVVQDLSTEKTLRKYKNYVRFKVSLYTGKYIEGNLLKLVYLPKKDKLALKIYNKHESRTGIILQSRRKVKKIEIFR